MREGEMSMAKKMRKNIFILLFLIIFIFVNFSNVKATLDGYSNYSEGSKFIITKDSYRYVIEEKQVLFVKWDEAKKDPEDKIYFKKGEIVEYTGNNKTTSGGTTYFEVKQDSKKAFIHSSNLDVYKSTRPNSITDFIAKYNIKGIKDEADLIKKVQELIKKTNSEGYDKFDVAVQSANNNINSIKNGTKSREEKKKRLAESYKDLLSDIGYVKDDTAFLALAYKYAWEYQVLIQMDEDYGEDDGKDKDWKKEFDKAYNKYKNAKNDTERDAALSVMEEAMLNMTDEEKKGKVDGKKRSDIYKEAETEKIDKEYEASKDGEIYKEPNKISSGDTSEQSLDDMISDADAFTGKGNIIYNETVLQDFSKTFYNIMLTVGIFVAVIIGGILGIKFMTSGLEEKADVKKVLLIYLIGCIVVFGGFTIWKIIVDVMQNVWG